VGEQRVGLKAGTGNEEMRNEEMETLMVRRTMGNALAESRRPGFHCFGIQLIKGWHLCV